MAPFDLSYWHPTTKIYAYLGVFGFFRIFFCKKSDPTRVKSHLKNPAFGRHQLSRPMWIVAPIFLLGADSIFLWGGGVQFGTPPRF